MRNSSSLDWLRFMHTPNDYRVSRYVPSFRTGSTDVNTIQHRYFQEPKQECTVCSTSGAYYLSAIACFCLTFIYPPAVIGAVICVCRAKKARKGGRK